MKLSEKLAPMVAALGLMGAPDVAQANEPQPAVRQVVDALQIRFNDTKLQEVAFPDGKKATSAMQTFDVGEAAGLCLPSADEQVMLRAKEDPPLTLEVDAACPGGFIPFQGRDRDLAFRLVRPEGIAAVGVYLFPKEGSEGRVTINHTDTVLPGDEQIHAIKKPQATEPKTDKFQTTLGAEAFAGYQILLDDTLTEGTPTFGVELSAQCVGAFPILNDAAICVGARIQANRYDRPLGEDENYTRNRKQDVTGYGITPTGHVELHAQFGADEMNIRGEIGPTIAFYEGIDDSHTSNTTGESITTDPSINLGLVGQLVIEAGFSVAPHLRCGPRATAGMQYGAIEIPSAKQADFLYGVGASGFCAAEF
ncbi:hypothetical protein KBD59_05880 [Candidatus Gracilibacteria bacterium]|nr:hypothetical protein [Candidatus Gracilibacteria bacterium]